MSEHAERLRNEAMLETNRDDPLAQDILAVLAALDAANAEIERWKEAAEAYKADLDSYDAVLGRRMAERDKAQADAVEVAMDKEEEMSGDDVKRLTPERWEDKVRWTRKRNALPLDLAWSFDKLLSEIDALRARVAELEAAGDGLADKYGKFVDHDAPALARWREVRGG